MKVVSDLPETTKRPAKVRDAACDFAKKHPGKWCLVKTAKRPSNAHQYASNWRGVVGSDGYEFRVMKNNVYARYTPQSGK